MESTEEKPRSPGAIARRWVVPAIILGLALTLGLLHGHILTGVASFMTIRDPLERADLILPLYHDADTVPFAAADLYRRGYADLVAVGRTRPGRLEAAGLLPPKAEVWRAVLEAEGVPRKAIVPIGFHIESDAEMARAVAAFLASRGKSRLIVVASAPLSRIARYDFRQGLTGSPVVARIYSVRPGEFDERTWWRSRHGWVTYFDAFFLLALRPLRQ